METILLAIGVARASIPEISSLIQTLLAEKRDPTPEEIAKAKASQKSEEDDFNKDL